jgi:hypothetical protein
MNDRPKAVEPAAQRRQRLSAALRENLKRRKAQAKRRQATDQATEVVEPTGKPHDSAGIVDDK